MQTAPASPQVPLFTSYQKFVVALLAFLQFTVVLDFMILSPLGAILLQELGITTVQFGLVVSAYAFSAGISGLLAAGFADRFDRKKWLLFFYSGFVIGTFLCGLAPSYHFLLAARVFTGVFGGVVSGISFAIVADLFPLSVRGRVMGTVQSAFAASQVLGIPIGLWAATHWGWHSPFLMIVAVSVIVGAVIVVWMRPITDHIGAHGDRHPIRHLWETAVKPRHVVGFSSTLLLAIGGFMLMPFGSAFTVHNLGIPLEQLPMVYMVTGISSMFLGPWLGRLGDRVGKYRVFVFASLFTTAIILLYTQLGVTPLWIVIGISVLQFAGIAGRIASAQALNSAVPKPQDRGAYMAITSSLQQLSGGLAAWIAGMIVVQSANGKLLHYEELGWVVAGAMLLTIGLMYRVHRLVDGDMPRPVPATSASIPEGT